MPIEVSCRKCGKAYRVSEQLAGRKFRCKECQTTVAVPTVAYEEEDIEFEDEPSWTQPAPRSLPRRSRPGRAKVATSAATFTVRKLFGVLAMLLAAMMCLAIIVQTLNGNFRALGGLIVACAVGGVGIKWLRT